jgi:hypothetical protein
MPATARMASVVPSALPARRRPIRDVSGRSRIPCMNPRNTSERHCPHSSSNTDTGSVRLRGTGRVRTPSWFSTPRRTVGARTTTRSISAFTSASLVPRRHRHITVVPCRFGSTASCRTPTSWSELLTSRTRLSTLLTVFRASSSLLHPTPCLGLSSIRHFPLCPHWHSAITASYCHAFRFFAQHMTTFDNSTATANPS